MQHFFVVKMNKWKRWLIVLVMALFAAIYLVTQTLGTFSVFSTENGPRALIKSGKDDSKQVALTFNISWGQEKVHTILDVLDKQKVQATFFVSGEWAERHPEIVEKITEANHELGMLGYRYKSYVEQDIEEVRKDLLRAREVFQKLGYSNVTLLRPPSGQFNEDVLKLAENMGFSVIYWSVNPNDWKNPGTEKIVNHVLENTSSGDIILLHASDVIKQTETALTEIIPAIKKDKLTFITISELISNSSSESKEVK
ncbi:polysaccharide deacetylase family sporulation protein PdaB [Salirhabdus sp. Marseille-P4669]|uniref:polysaccharide deacetylase family sporulation protein PdaB n=1 Tax=Salirhabdus sp. Marseille-P4669 TaxID=2042310 RepID=UPI000C7BAB05|nr:polysaccharide deacetylase family sporulation protein PdaB [Salirhabdus sp. Marseille-P4669]